MTPPNQLLEDLVIGTAIKSIDFDPVELQLPIIATRAGRLRRRAHMKKAGVAGASLAVVIALVSSMTGGTHRAVRVESPSDGHGNVRVTTPVSTPTHQIVTTTTARSLIAPPPADSPLGNPAVLPVATPATEPAPRHSGVSTPTTARDALPSNTTPTTAAPSPYPPMDDSATARITIVFDNDGLHAPATFPSGADEVLFLDQRPHVYKDDSSFLEWNDPTFGLQVVERWNPSLMVLLQGDFAPGPVVFSVVDKVNTPLSATTLTVTFTA